jgi:Metallo-beta-lactamase superfamily
MTAVAFHRVDRDLAIIRNVTLRLRTLADSAPEPTCNAPTNGPSDAPTGPPPKCASMADIEPNGPESPLLPTRAVCHCLLIETPSSGLVLVEIGISSTVIERHREALGDEFPSRAERVLDIEQTAARQVCRLIPTGWDVRHVVLTHLDLDHARGLADFPHAQVHMHDAEYRAATGAPAGQLREPASSCSSEGKGSS